MSNWEKDITIEFKEHDLYRKLLYEKREKGRAYESFSKDALYLLASNVIYGTWYTNFLASSPSYEDELFFDRGHRLDRYEGKRNVENALNLFVHSVENGLKDNKSISELFRNLMHHAEVEEITGVPEEIVGVCRRHGIKNVVD